MISETNGFAQKYPAEGIALDLDAHQFLSKEAFEKLMDYNSLIDLSFEEK